MRGRGVPGEELEEIEDPAEWHGSLTLLSDSAMLVSSELKGVVALAETMSPCLAAAVGRCETQPRACLWRTKVTAEDQNAGCETPTLELRLSKAHSKIPYRIHQLLVRLNPVALCRRTLRDVERSRLCRSNLARFTNRDLSGLRKHCSAAPALPEQALRDITSKKSTICALFWSPTEAVHQVNHKYRQPRTVVQAHPWPSSRIICSVLAQPHI